MEEQEHCPTILISDAPAKSDAFRSHDKVAAAVIELIKKEKGGMTIGIEGAWGTGKSTIINFVGASLSQDPDIAFITYDAWAHQGDPLRRSFLERIIGVIAKKKWVDQEKWEYVLGTLAKRVHSSTTTKTPLFTVEGKWFAASLLCVPGGAAILEGVIDSWPWSTSKLDDVLHLLTYGIAFFLSFSPLVVLGWVLSGHTKGKPFLGFIANEQVTKEESESTEDPDPTSLEFSRRFSELLGEALANEKRKVVLIVDNLDRIEEDVARSMWATMRTFLEYGEYERPDWFTRLWVVVPYAMESLKKVLHVSEDENGVFAFIDKVFQVHFYVSPPVLSDWKQYLTSRVQEAFPRHKDDDLELHKVYRTWTQNAERAERPTPRDLIIFINDVGAIHRQWRDTFPLSHMAYYCLIRRKDSDVAKQLLDGKIPLAADKELLGDNLADNVAALYFNRDVAHARQILLKPELTKLLSKGDVKEFRVFEEKHAGLFTVLERQLETILADWGTVETATIARATKCLLLDDILSKASPAEARSIKERLFDACRRIEYWNPIDSDVITGLWATAAANGTIEYAGALVSSLKGSYEKAKVNERADFPDVSGWLKLYVDFLKEIKSRGLMPEFTGHLLPGTQREWVLAAEYLHDASPTKDIADDVAPNFNASELTAEFVRVIQNDTYAAAHTAALKLTMEKALRPNYQELCSAIQRKLNDNPATLSSRAYELIFSIWIMGKLDPAVTGTEVSMASNGQLLHYLQNALGSKDYSTVSLIMFLVMKDRPQLNQDTNFQTSSAGFSNMQSMLGEPEKFPEIAAAFAAFVEQHLVSGTVAEIMISNPMSRKWLRECVLRMAMSGALPKTYSAGDLMKTWPFVDQVDKEGAKRPSAVFNVISAINADHLVDLEISKQSFDPSIARLCLALTMQPGAIHKSTQEWLEHGLDGIAVDVWRTQILEDGELIVLLTEARKKLTTLLMGVKYLDALTSIASQIADGQEAGRRAPERWREFFEPLKHDLRMSLQEKLLDIAKQKNGDIKPLFFTIFQPEVFKLEKLKGDEEVVKKLFTPFLLARNVPGLILISSLITENRNSLDRLGAKHNISEFVERVQEAMQETKGDESDALIQQIAALLKIEPKQESAKPEEAK